MRTNRHPLENIFWLHTNMNTILPRSDDDSPGTTYPKLKILVGGLVFGGRAPDVRVVPSAVMIQWG